MMSETLDSVNSRSDALSFDDSMLRMERRIRRGMYASVALSVPFAFAFAHWRVGTGLLLGGVLALLNYHWLRSSIAAAFGVATGGAKPNLTFTRYFLRYVTIGVVIVVAHLLEIASGVAALFGLSSFAVAALIEAFMQVCFAIMHQKER